MKDCCRRSVGAAIGIAMAAFAGHAAHAQDLPPRSVYEAMLAANRASGWVAFRDFNGN